MCVKSNTRSFSLLPGWSLARELETARRIWGQSEPWKNSNIFLTCCQVKRALNSSKMMAKMSFFFLRAWWRSSFQFHDESEFKLYFFLERVNLHRLSRRDAKTCTKLMIVIIIDLIKRFEGRLNSAVDTLLYACYFLDELKFHFLSFSSVNLRCFKLQFWFSVWKWTELKSQLSWRWR